MPLSLLSMQKRLMARAAAPVVLAIAAAILCSCQVRGAQVPQSPFLRFFERPSGLLLYLASDGNVHVIDQKGGARRALTSDAGAKEDRQVAYSSPAWSPDGKRVAFSRVTADGSGEVTDAALFTAGADGRNLTKVLSGSRLRPFYLYWSPDSVTVSLLSSVTGESFLEMGVVTAGQEGTYRFLDRGSPYYWHWRADSGAILVHANIGRQGSDGERLSLLSLAPRVERSQIDVPPGVFQSPSFSPDGKSVAYASTAPQAVFTLHLDSLDGSGRRTVATDVGGAFLQFSRDGRRIAYLAAASLQPVPAGTLTVVDLGPQSRKRTLTESPVLEFFWAPNGRTISFVVPDSGDDVDPLFFQDARLVYVRLMGFDVVTGKTWLIARFPPSRGFFSVLPFFDQYQRSSSPWSPDSKYIAFTALTDKGSPGLFVVRADGNIKPRFLTSGDEAFWSSR